MIAPFMVAQTPGIIFGNGRIGELSGKIKAYGTKVLLVTGARSFVLSRGWKTLTAELERKGITWYHTKVMGEPTPELIDETVTAFRDKDIQVVVAIGGGSALDTGKAVSAMLTVTAPICAYLEGVGSTIHPGSKIPFIALPTTAGTGSEATANAVISRVSNDGFKRSLRHPNFVPDIALIDPELAVGASAALTAASGMDALTQLLESYVSDTASPVTDVLAEHGLRYIKDNLVESCGDEYADDPDVRGAVAYAALLSGMTLANAGLGVVHGFARVIGGLYPVRHGALCGALLAGATAITIEKLKETEGIRCPTLRKYARAGRILSGRPGTSIGEGCRLLTGLLHEWTTLFEIPVLIAQGVPAEDFSRIAQMTDPKNNPGNLTKDDMVQILTYTVVGKNT